MPDKVHKSCFLVILPISSMHYFSFMFSSAPNNAYTYYINQSTPIGLAFSPCKSSRWLIDYDHQYGRVCHDCPEWNLDLDKKSNIHIPPSSPSFPEPVFKPGGQSVNQQHVDGNKGDEEQQHAAHAAYRPCSTARKVTAARTVNSTATAKARDEVENCSKLNRISIRQELLLQVYNILLSTILVMLFMLPWDSVTDKTIKRIDWFG